MKFVWGGCANVPLSGAVGGDTGEGGRRWSGPVKSPVMFAVPEPRVSAPMTASRS